MFKPLQSSWRGFWIVLCLATAAAAQPAGEPPQLNFLKQLGGDLALGGADAGSEVTFAGSFKIAEGQRRGVLMIKATMAPNWHIYSLTQQPGGPIKSTIAVSDSKDYRISGPFQPDQPPHIYEDDVFSVPIEEHALEVIFSAPIEITDGVDPQSLVINAVYNGQVCETDGSCIPINNRQIPAEFAGYYQAARRTDQYRSEGSHVTLSGKIQPAMVQAGGKLTLMITAAPTSPYHIYQHAAKDHQGLYKPTLFVPVVPEGFKISRPVASSPAIEESVDVANDVVVFHEGEVTWSFEIDVPADASAGTYEIGGQIGYQACTALEAPNPACDFPAGVSFQAAVTVGTQTDARAVNVTFPDPADDAAELNYADVDSASIAFWKTSSAAVASGKRLDLANLKTSLTETNKKPFVYAALFALLGGFVLNFMPCVLPVIGLKIMSFVTQAGKDRQRVFLLNVWYSLGLLAVFMVLATLAAFLSFGWGQQSQSDVFNITMAAVIFVMGLSFLGVWEIPIPGFVGTGKAVEIAEQEGALAAFVKGCITTILAVPCSGPGIATALAWCQGKPPAMIYLVFACMALGMASPYLIIGLNPKLASFLPKPGAWMETFKQVMGFFLLGTVVFIMSYIQWHLLLPTLMLLFGLWAACWWIGRIPITAAAQAKIRNWLYAGGFAALVGMMAMFWLRDITAQRFEAAVDRAMVERGTQEVTPRAHSEHELPWEPFSTQRLADETAEQNTVLVDFTADW